MSRTKPVEVMIFGFSDCGQEELLMKSTDPLDKVKVKKADLYKGKNAIVSRHFNSAGGVHCTVKTYDTKEQEKFKRKGSATYDKASAILLVFDVAKFESWELITGW